MHEPPNHDLRPQPNAVLFDLDDTLVDHSSALRAGALALAEAAHISGDRKAFGAGGRRSRRRNIHATYTVNSVRGHVPRTNLGCG